jgi:hypothetical protein
MESGFVIYVYNTMEYCPEADTTPTYWHMIFHVMYVSNIKIIPGILNIPDVGRRNLTLYVYNTTVLSGSLESQHICKYNHD